MLKILAGSPKVLTGLVSTATAKLAVHEPVTDSRSSLCMSHNVSVCAMYLTSTVCY